MSGSVSVRWGHSTLLCTVDPETPQIPHADPDTSSPLPYLSSDRPFASKPEISPLPIPSLPSPQHSATGTPLFICQEAILQLEPHFRGSPTNLQTHTNAYTCIIAMCIYVCTCNIHECSVTHTHIYTHADHTRLHCGPWRQAINWCSSK